MYIIPPGLFQLLHRHHLWIKGTNVTGCEFYQYTYLIISDKDIQSVITLVLDYIIENVWNSLIVCYVTYTVWRYVFLHPALSSNCFFSLNQFKPEFKIWMSHCAPSSSVSKVPSATEQRFITLATGQTSYARWHFGDTHSRCATV